LECPELRAHCSHRIDAGASILRSAVSDYTKPFLTLLEQWDKRPQVRLVVTVHFVGVVDPINVNVLRERVHPARDEDFADGLINAELAAGIG
jgi:hypothetical protein